MNIIRKGTVMLCLRKGNYGQITAGFLYVLASDARYDEGWIVNDKEVLYGYPLNMFKIVVEP